MSQDNSMNVFDSDIATLPDLAKKFLFQLRFNFQNEGFRSRLTSGLTWIDSDVTKDIILRAKTAVIPAKEFSDMVTEYMGTKISFPGKMNISGEMSVTFDEFQDLAITGIIGNWQELIVKQSFHDYAQQPTDIGSDANDNDQQLTGGAYSNYASTYMATCDVIMYDSTLKRPLPFIWRLYRVWPKNMATADLGAEDDGKLQRSVTFSYSNWELIPRSEA